MLVEKQLQQAANPEKAKILQRFFKTGKGEYGEGDIFLGITVPEQRKIAKQHADLSLYQLQKLLNSKIHENRLVALLILVNKFAKADDKQQKQIADFYLKNTHNINNWDLVDLSAHQILGQYLFDKDKQILCKLANSQLLWERRIAIISTFWFIKQNQFEDALKIAGLLINDNHDLIHKAVGWMLREIGKKDQEVEEQFLDKHYKKMPRTMLRYAIEKFDDQKRKHYMS